MNASQLAFAGLLFVHPDDARADPDTGEKHGIARVCALCDKRFASGGGGQLAAHGKRHVRRGEAVERGYAFHASERFFIADKGTALAIRRAGDPE